MDKGPTHQINVSTVESAQDDESNAPDMNAHIHETFGELSNKKSTQKSTLTEHYSHETKAFLDSGV